MRTLTTIAFALSILFCLNGCSKDKTHSVNCAKIRAGILNNDTEAVREEINRLAYFYTPDPAASDLYGHRLNIENLALKLRGECNFTISTGCYNCIKTLPPQTELFITVSSGSTTVHKVIDLSYTSSKRLVFANMHD